jgi:hypothetical protein
MSAAANPAAPPPTMTTESGALRERAFAAPDPGIFSRT